MKSAKMKLMIALLALILVALIGYILLPALKQPHSQTPPVTVPSGTTLPVAATLPGETAASTEATAPQETLVTTPNLPEQVTGEEIPGIFASKAFVYDCTEDTFLYMKNTEYTKLYPASITKLMSAYLILQYLQMDEHLTFTEEIAAVVAGDASVSGLEVGDTATVRDLLYGTLLTSGSDSTHTLTVNIGWRLANDPTLEAIEAERVFVEKMNETAAAIGMTHTHFTNCDGYPNYFLATTIHDVVLLGKLCLQTPELVEIMSTPSYTMDLGEGKTLQQTNGNWLVLPWSEFYTPEAVGMKTGSTRAAGACLLSAFRVDGKEYLIGVFQCESNYDRLEQTLRLYRGVILGEEVVYIPPETEP